MPFPLFAQQPMTRWDGVTHNFRAENSGFNAGDAGGLALVLLASAGVVFLLRKWQQNEATKRQIDDPESLFEELCRKRGVRGLHRLRVKTLAAENGLSPADVFVRPDLFETPGKRARPAYRELREKLFYNEFD